MSSPSIKCNICLGDLKPENILGNLVVCNHCHGTYKIENLQQMKAANRFKIIVGLVVLVASVASAKSLGMFDSDTAKLEKKVDTLSLEQTQALKQQCLNQGNTECLRVAYKRLTELDPSDVGFQANYAFTLTDLKKYKDALLIYEKIIADGQGTYDLMAYYGTTLNALGETEKAIEWFQNSLSLNPNLIDITQQLAVAMTKTKRHYEAASLLDSFIAKFPRSEGSLKGNLISIKSQIKKDPTKSASTGSLKLLTIRGSHYFLPIGFGDSTPLQSFMVDTGASSLVMKTEDITKLFPAAVRKAEKAQIRLADGRTENAFVTTIPELQVGPWKVKNIETIYCDNCSNLAGRSLLSKFAMKTSPKGELETMELALVK